MPTPGATLIVMPWYPLALPPYQAGIAGAVLRRAGIPTEIRFLTLDFMEDCVGEGLTVADYTGVSLRQPGLGLRDWIFAVPPFRHASEAADAEYLAFLRSFDIPDELLRAALAMRGLAPAFLERMADEVRAIGPQVVGFTSTFNQNVPSLALAKILKARDPSLSVVFGGANCDGPMGAALHRAFLS